MNDTRGYPSPPEPDADTLHQHDRVYYDRDGIQITSQSLIAHGRRYPVAELRRIRTLRGPRSDVALAAGVLALAMLFTIARVGERLDKAGWLGALTVLGVLFGLMISGNLLRPRSYALIAEFHRQPVILVLVGSGRRYGQIARALKRALEYYQ
jgi:hypothetical protein